MNRKPKSSRARKRRLAQTQATAIHFETLEDRHLLAGVTVGNATDVLSPTADTTSITALIANDGGDGISLREAITASNNTLGADTITFNGSVFTGETASVIRLTQGELVVSEELTIDGSSGTDVIVSGDADANDGSLIDNRRVLNFNAPSGTLTLSNLTVTGERTSSSGGGGIYSVSGHITLNNSLVSGNRAHRNFTDGGGIRTIYGNVSLLNSTVSENSTSREGGGIILGRFNASDDERLTIINSIVTGNTDNGTAPDLFVSGDVENNLIVEHSLIGGTTGSGISATTGAGNILNQPALLGPLADYGGPTLTRALLPGSPAINAGSNSLAVDADGNPLLTDQSGENRLKFGTVDIGAFETDIDVASTLAPKITSVGRDEGGVLARPDLLSTFPSLLIGM